MHHFPPAKVVQARQNLMHQFAPGPQPAIGGLGHPAPCGQQPRPSAIQPSPQLPSARSGVSDDRTPRTKTLPRCRPPASAETPHPAQEPHAPEPTQSCRRPRAPTCGTLRKNPMHQIGPPRVPGRAAIDGCLAAKPHAPIQGAARPQGRVSPAEHRNDAAAEGPVARTPDAKRPAPSMIAPLAIRQGTNGARTPLHQFSLPRASQLIRRSRRGARGQKPHAPKPTLPPAVLVETHHPAHEPHVSAPTQSCRQPPAPTCGTLRKNPVHQFGPAPVPAARPTFIDGWRQNPMHQNGPAPVPAARSASIRSVPLANRVPAA